MKITTFIQLTAANKTCMGYWCPEVCLQTQILNILLHAFQYPVEISRSPPLMAEPPPEKEFLMHTKTSPN